MIVTAAGAAATSPLAHLLNDGLQRMGLASTVEQRQQLLRYLELLGRWNQTYNLTSIRDPEAMLSQHVLDCLAVVAPLRREVAGAPRPRLLDVGSGAGLPGVVIAVAAPEVQVTCVDSVGKKTAFIAHAAGALGLKNVAAFHGRVEAMTTGPFDVITSRAFSSLRDLVGATGHLLTVEGSWMAMKGQRPDAELAELDPNAHVFHVEPIRVPTLDAERCIAWIRRSTDSERSL